MGKHGNPTEENPETALRLETRNNLELRVDERMVSLESSTDRTTVQDGPMPSTEIVYVEEA